MNAWLSWMLAAEPAEPADYGEVARMVNATKNQNPAASAAWSSVPGRILP